MEGSLLICSTSRVHPTIGIWAGAPGQSSWVSYAMNGSKSEIPQLMTSEQPPALLPAFQDKLQLLLLPGPKSQACTPISQEARRPRAQRRPEWEPAHRPAHPQSRAGRSGTVSGWTTVLTGQWPVLFVQGLGQVLNSEIMLVT